MSVAGVPNLIREMWVKYYYLFKQYKNALCETNNKVYAYIVKHNYMLDGMLFNICKAQLHVSATIVGHL